LEQDAWKLADFGAIAETNFKRKFATVDSRGTPCYRAPELLTATVYDAKSDIWAVGCIFYELTAKAKAFSNDRSVYSYANSPTKLSIPQSRFDWTIERGARREDMELLISRMLRVDPEARPSSSDLQSTTSTLGKSVPF
jgi:NIMA (never in mitosis gene a)-related kinase